MSADVEVQFVAARAMSVGELSQVVLNLLVNAAHAIADKVGTDSNEIGRITIITCKMGTGPKLISGTQESYSTWDSLPSFRAVLHH